MKLTETQVRVLTYLSANPGALIGRSWAGSLAGLSRRGLVQRAGGWGATGYEWELTAAGRKALEATRA